MFYSHEILTDRKHGVATIWLVATLGSKSSLKKVTRKAILDVNVPKAVETIVEPSAPMALRLQGNLLYGVTRVYSQQCGYVLNDAQTFRDKLRETGLALGRAGIEIDPEAGRVRPDQLNLPDDPAFMPELDMGFDLNLFDLPTSSDSSRASSLLGPLSLIASSQTSRDVDEPHLILPSEDISGLGLADFGLGVGSSSIGGKPPGGPSMFEESAFNDGLGMEIDLEGNIIEAPAAAERVRQSSAPSPTGPGNRTGSDTGCSERVTAEQEEQMQAFGDGRSLMFDDRAMIFSDEAPVLRTDQPFSPHPEETANQAIDRHTSSVHTEVEHSSVVGQVAPQRHHRVKHPIQPDRQTELTNRELAAWDKDYLINMAQADTLKAKFSSTLAQAKKNAEYLVLGIGLSGLGREFDRDGGLAANHPLRIAFSGQTLFDGLTGRHSSPAGKKRNRENDEEGLDEDHDEEARRFRARNSTEEEIGRGGPVGGIGFGDQDGVLIQGDDMGIEVGRHAPPSLPDPETIRSSLPWNIYTSSRRGSARPGLPPGISSSIGVLGHDFEPALGPPSALPPRSRLTSASPLDGRGKQKRWSSLELPGSEDITSRSVEDDDLVLSRRDDDDFQLYEPAVDASIQPAANSQSLASMLEDEANNFYAFLAAEIASRKPVQERGESQDLRSDSEGAEEGTITFEELLPPKSNSKAVGAQGLLHVLSLATRGVIEVMQEEVFGEINLSLVGGFGEQSEEDVEMAEE